MLTIEECKKYILEKHLDDSKIEYIRNYLYAIAQEIIRKNIEEYESNIGKTIKSK